MPFNVTSYDSSTNRIVVPAATEESVVPGDLKVSGNLVVSGTTTTVNSEVATADRYIALNANYSTDSALDGGLVINVDPEGSTKIDGGSATLTLLSTLTFKVNADVTANFAADDIIQISNAADPGDNGLYQVHSTSLGGGETTITIKGGSNNPDGSVSGFVKTALDTSSSTVDGQAIVAVVKVGVLQTDVANGKFQVAFGSTNLSFANLLMSTDSITASALAADNLTAGDAAVTLETSSGNVVVDSNAGSAKLDGHTGVEIVSSNSGEVDITSAANVDINATTGLTMDSAALSIDSTDTTNLTMTANSDDNKVFTFAALNSGSGMARLDIDAKTTIQIDSGDISIDGTDDSNFTVTGSGKDLDLAVAGGGTQELRLASAGTGASALHLNASAGGINIDSADMIDIDAADEITIDTTSADGHIALTSAHTAGQAVLISANAHAGSILDIDAGVMDVDVQAGYTLDATGISLDSDAASNFTTSSGALTLDGAGGVSIAGNSAEVDITTTGALDLNSGAFTLDASSMSFDGNASSNFTMAANTGSTQTLTIAASNADGSNVANIDIDADGTIDIDGAGGINIGKAADVAFDVDSAAFDLDASGAVTIDTSGSSNISLTADNKIQLRGANDSDLRLDANASGNKKLELRARNSGSGEGNIDVDCSSGGTIALAAGGTAVLSVVAGGMTADQDLTFSAEKSAVFGSLSLMPTYALDSGVTCAAGDVLAIKSNGKVIKADADAIATMRVLGVACEAQSSAGGNVRVASVGEMSGASGSGYDSLTTGSPVYVSTTAGQITQTAPSGAADVVFEIGFAVSATKIFVAPRFIAEL